MSTHRAAKVDDAPIFCVHNRSNGFPKNHRIKQFGGRGAMACPFTWNNRPYGLSTATRADA